MKRPIASLKVRALRWLAGREHSRAELRTRLLHLAAQVKSDDKTEAALDQVKQGSDDAAPADPVAAVESLLDWLEQNGYLDNQRFVEAKVRSRQERYGPARIEMELRHHGLEIDPRSLSELKAGEFERARSVWSRKFGTVAQDAAGRIRQARFLITRGYSTDVVRRVVRGQAEDD